MNVQQIENLTQQLQGMEPLRTSKDGAELYGILQPLSVQLRRLLQGPWSHEEMRRVNAFAAMNERPAAELDPALAEAEVALIAARSEFDQAERLWQTASLALLKVESQTRNLSDSYGNVLHAPDKLRAELQQAKADQEAARVNREEKLEASRLALVARNRLAYSLQQQRIAADLQASRAKAEAEKQVAKQRERERQAASLERLSMAVPS